MALGVLSIQFNLRTDSSAASHRARFRAVENITHSLVGATLAELMLPPTATATQRRLFFIAGIVAANLPDADLLYTRITPPPLGYLLHHRGHTHTIVGCALIAVCGWLLTRLPPARRLIAESPQRFWWLIVVALSSHLVLDSWNSYGIHPFWPLDNRWYYGDAIFILEPWFWVLLGIPIAANALTRRRRIVLVAGLIALTVAPVWFGMIPMGAIAPLAALGVILALTTRRAAPRVRSATGLATVALFVGTMFGLSHLARGLSLASLGTSSPREIVDVILNPKPAAPLCWDALTVEKNEASGDYFLRRGTLALFDGWLPMRACDAASHNPTAIGASRSRVVWSEPLRESLERLRALSRDDCWVRAWLQFGRAPSLGDQEIADFRFGGRGRSNFTAMQLLPPATAKVCPPNLTDWGVPRADLLDRRLGH